jgi:ribosomal protein S6
MTDETTNEKDFLDSKTYEIGYLLSPLVTEENLVPEVTKAILDPLAKVGATVISQNDPQLRKLAYVMSRSINHKRSSFKDAYFGAIKFSVTTDKLTDIKEAVEKSDLIIRFLIIEASKVSEKNIARNPRAGRQAADGDSPEVLPTTEVSAEEVKDKEVDSVQIDQEIDELLAV